MRKKIKADIIKALLANSGNKCAFPGCNEPIINEDYALVGQLCHIEAAEPGGPRYNENQTDLERNGYNNLMYMCYKHHKETHDVEKYSTIMLKKMKYNHENNYKYNPFSFDFSLVFKINDDFKNYIDEIEEIYQNREFDEKMEFNSNATFEELNGKIEEIIDWFRNYFSLQLNEYLENLNDNIIKKMKQLGYDTKLWEEQKYYDNPFWSPLWEITHLGLGNYLNELECIFIQISIMYYKEYLMTNSNDEEIKEKFIKLKNKLKQIVQFATLMD